MQSTTRERERDKKSVRIYFTFTYANIYEAKQIGLKSEKDGRWRLTWESKVLSHDGAVQLSTIDILISLFNG
jgi:hypothetical protein